MIATIKVIQYNLSLLSYMIYFDDFLVNSQTSLNLVKKYTRYGEVMTPLRTRQAIAEYSPSIILDQIKNSSVISNPIGTQPFYWVSFDI